MSYEELEARAQSGKLLKRGDWVTYAYFGTVHMYDVGQVTVVLDRELFGFPYAVEWASGHTSGYFAHRQLMRISEDEAIMFIMAGKVKP